MHNIMLRAAALLALLVVGCVHACTPVSQLPGSASVGVGFNVVTGASVNYPLVTFTYDQCKNYTNAWNGQSFTYADQLLMVPAVSFGVEAFLFRSSSEYGAFLASGMGIGVTKSLERAAFSLSVQMQTANSVFQASGSALVQAREQYNMYSLGLSPVTALKPSSILAAALASLPPTYDNNTQAQYQQFIETFGTHVVSSATLGGEGSILYAATESYSEQTSEHVITANAVISFIGLKTQIGTSTNRQTTSQQFNSSVNILQQELIGGSPSLPFSEWSKWIRSVQLVPAVTQSTLLPIASLVSNATLRSNVEQAINDYYAANQKNQPPVQPPPVLYYPSNCASSSTCERCNAGQVMVSGGWVDGWITCPIQCCNVGFSYALASSFAATKSLPTNAKSDTAATTSSSPSPPPPPKPSSATVLPSGYQGLGIGFDLLSGLPKYQQVVQFSFNNNNIYVNPFNNSFEFLYPDQVIVSSATSDGIQASSFLSQQSYASYLTKQFGVSVAYPGAFSFSHEVTSVRAIFEARQAVLVRVDQDLALYSMMTLPSFLLNTTNQFQNDLASLPTTYNQDLYAAFVATYGTHVVSGGSFGGRGTMIAAVDHDFYVANTQEDIESQAQILFLELSGRQSEGTLNSDFLAASYANMQLVGGEYEQYQVSQWSSWLETTQFVPSQTTGSLVPLTQFVTDATIQANLQTYISSYLGAQPKYVAPMPTLNSSLVTSSPSAIAMHNECGTNGFWIGGSSYRGVEGNYICQPNYCSKFDWSGGQSNSTITWCNCITVDASSCPSGMVVKDYQNEHKYHSSTADLYPFTCCHVCVTL